MRIMDALMAFPSIVLAMVVSAVLGSSLTNVVIALAIATTPHTARIVRASVLLEKEQEYIAAARSIGVGEWTILFKHVLRNVAGPLIVRLTYVFAIAILAEKPLCPSLVPVRRRPPPPSARSSPKAAISCAKPRGSRCFLALRSSPASSASTCSATACATCSTPA